MSLTDIHAETAKHICGPVSMLNKFVNHPYTSDRENKIGPRIEP